MSDVICTYRWEMSTQNVANRYYAEGELIDAGSVRNGHRYMLMVYLVHDEMRQFDGFEVIDPDERGGQRVYVGSSNDHDACELLANMAPLLGKRRAYRLIFDAVKNAPDKVERFGYEWLTKTMQDWPAIARES